MNGKKRYIPIVALGALLIALLAILPVAAAGEVGFIDPNDIRDANDGSLSDATPDEQEYSRQGGKAGIFFEDEDFDKPLRRVLILSWDTDGAGTGDIARHSNVIEDATLTDLDTMTTDVFEKLAAGDYIYVGQQRPIDSNEFRTVRKVVSVVQTQETQNEAAFADRRFDVTVDDAFEFDGSAQNINRVRDTMTRMDAFSDNYKEIGVAEVVTATATDRIDVDAPILGSNVSSTSNLATTSPQSRLAGALDTRLTDDDVLVFRQASPNAVKADIDTVTDGGRITADTDFDAAPYYVVYWAAINNNTGSSITVQSQATTQPQTLVLKETGDGTGDFAAKIDLIPVNVETTWGSISDPPGDSDRGKATTLSVRVEGYDDLRVEYPAPPTDNDGMEYRPPASADESSGRTVIASHTITVKTLPDFGIDIPRLPVSELDTLTVNHPDGSESLRVETTDPVFANFSPEDGHSTSNSRPEVSATVTDGGSGLKESGLGIVFAIKEAGAANAQFAYNNPRDSDNPNVMKAPDEADTRTAPGGFTVRGRLSAADDLSGDGEIWWWIKATDIAGNTVYSDQEPTLSAGGDDTCEATSESALLADANSANPKCDPYVIRVDDTDPKMVHAETGRWWDTSLSTGDSDDKTEYRPAKSKDSSILVIFDEPLDDTPGGSVRASDFRVEGSQPADAFVQNVKVRNDNVVEGASDTGDGNADLYDSASVPQFVGQERGYVFLTLSSPLAPNARPKVEMVGNIEDRAGNEQTTLQKDDDALDRIGPKLTVTFDEGVRPVTNKDVNVTIAANENIGTPKITFYKIESFAPAGGDSVQTRGRAQTVNGKFVSADRYTATLTATSNGLYAVNVTATDTGNNKGETGEVGKVGVVNGDENLNSASTLSTAIDVSSDTEDAILFERDKAIAAPDFDPGTDGVNKTYETDDANGYVRIDYSGEADEYTSASVALRVERAADDAADPPVTFRAERAAMEGDDLDTYGGVTIVSATFNGEDIADELKASANSARNVFQYYLDGVEEGTHKLRITVEDDAGNTNTTPHEGTIKVIERKKYSLTLNPGRNLVSLPGEPEDTAINAVIPAGHPITEVWTYDRAHPDGWLFATRGGDGMLGGTLKHITHDRAYWIATGSFTPLEVDIPKASTERSVFLPSIKIEQGWNLIPILDIDGDFKLDEQTAEKNYFGGLTTGEISQIYAFNTITNRYVSVEEHEVELGKGYWVWATRPGTLVP